MPKKISLISSVCVVVSFFVLILILLHNSSISPKHIKYVQIGDVKVKVELALTKEAQEQGLSGRSGLKDDTGMLFVFSYPDKYYFWMKDMHFPIDILWLVPTEGGVGLGEDQRIIYIKKNAQPETYLETFGPDQNTKYVLEVNAGFSDMYNLKVGDKVLFTY